MGFSGGLVLARSDVPLLELPLLAGREAAGPWPGAAVLRRTAGPYAWQILRWEGELPAGGPNALLAGSVAVTDAPAMVATVADGGLCQVRGRSPSGGSWSVFLDPVTAVDHGIPIPGPEEVRDAADRIAGWATEAGLRADRDALLTVLTRRADPRVEDLFVALADACGLPPAEPGPADSGGRVSGGPGSAAHPGHRPDARCPRGPRLEAAVLDLPRDRHLVLECAGDEQCYAQVWLRPDGTYQVEYRDCDPSEHYWTRTVSAEEVVSALAGWMSGEVAWREEFDWASLAEWFTEPTA